MNLIIEPNKSFNYGANELLAIGSRSSGEIGANFEELRKLI